MVNQEKLCIGKTQDEDKQNMVNQEKLCIGRTQDEDKQNKKHTTIPKQTHFHRRLLWTSLCLNISLVFIVTFIHYSGILGVPDFIGVGLRNFERI
jgi:hypothetical protein